MLIFRWRRWSSTMRTQGPRAAHWSAGLVGHLLSTGTLGLIPGEWRQIRRLYLTKEEIWILNVAPCLLTGLLYPGWSRIKMLSNQSNARSLGSHLVSFEIKVEKGQDRIQSVYIFRFYTVGEWGWLCQCAKDDSAEVVEGEDWRVSPRCLT